MTARPRIRSPHMLMAITLLGLVALIGCQGSPARLADVPDPSTTLGPGGELWVNPVHGGSASLLKNDKGAMSQTFSLDASKGGKFKFDRYTLDFPPNAVAGDAQVTISMSSSAIVECDLSISPAELNHFSQPVTLTMDLHGTNATPQNLAGVYIYWQAPGGWTKVGHKTDPVNFTVSADLQHFSVYRGGW
jgi:hypothetical protein